MPSLIAMFLKISGVESNPGPACTMGALIAQSIVLKGPMVHDLIDSYDLDGLAICVPKIIVDPDVIKMDAVPTGFSGLHLPCPTSTVRSRGGGLCYINRYTLNVKSHRLQLTL
jgi:hypothetical protein